MTRPFQPQGSGGSSSFGASSLTGSIVIGSVGNVVRILNGTTSPVYVSLTGAAATTDVVCEPAASGPAGPYGELRLPRGDETQRRAYFLQANTGAGTIFAQAGLDVLGR